MEVAKADLVKVYEAIGVDVANTWDDDTLKAKVAKLRILKDDDTEIEDDKTAKLYDKLVKAVDDGEEVNVVDGKPAAGKKEKPAKGEKPKAKKGGKKDDAPAAAPAPKKGKKDKPAPEKPAAKKKDKPAPEKKDKPKKPGRPKGEEGTRLQDVAPAWLRIAPLTDRGDGKTKAIIEILQAASEKKPKTKADILAEMVKRFPKKDGHDPDKMATTISNLVPSRLRQVRGIYTHQKMTEDGVKGYWIVGDGRTPPKGEKRGVGADPLGLLKSAAKKAVKAAGKVAKKAAKAVAGKK